MKARESFEVSNVRPEGAVCKLEFQRLKWAGHLLRSADDYLPARVAREDLRRHCVQGDSTRLFMDVPAGSSYQEILDLANDFDSWKTLMESFYKVRRPPGKKMRKSD